MPLPGGDVTEGVVRVGDTVRRPVGPHSTLVHRVLRHLAAQGFDGAPRLRGIDAQGREVLDFVEGEVAGRPWPGWVADHDRLVSVARLVRRLDDALVPLGLPPEVEERARTDRPPPLPRLGPATFIGHRDVTPENVVFRAGRAFALIDFDLVGPCRRIDEVANVVQWWAPWLDPADRQDAVRDVDVAARARLIVDAYGLGDERAALVDLMIAAAERSHVTMRERAVTLGGGWARMWFEEDVGAAILRRAAWLEVHRAELVAALTE